MADTQHSRTSGQAQADATYADNTSGDIGASDWRQEQRDIYESCAVLSSANTFSADQAFSGLVNVNRSNDEHIRLTHSSATGSPYISYYQNTTRVAFVQYSDSASAMKISCEEGGIQLLTGTGGSEQLALEIDTSQNSTFSGDVTTTSRIFVTQATPSIRLTETDSGNQTWDMVGVGGELQFRYNALASIALRLTTSGNATVSGDVTINGKTIIGDGSILTISTGAVTATTGFHTIAAETGTIDTLDTINGGTTGMILILKADSGDSITVAGGGNIDINTTGNFNMTGGGTITLIYDGSNWLETSRSAN